MVNIQDARLGIFKMLLLFLIAVYIAVFQLWRDGGYLQTEKISGVARFTLQQPTVDSDNNSGCDPKNTGCVNDFSDPTTLSYCSQSSLPYTGNKYPCQFYEHIGVEHMFESSIIVDTRITSQREDLVCESPEDQTCPTVYNATGSETTNYAVDIEAFTVLFDTAVAATNLDITGQSSEMEGWLLVKDNKAFCSSSPDARTGWGSATFTDTAPCYIKPNKTSANLDYFQVETLLQAAGSSLDSETSAGSGETYRESGVTLIMQVDYTNTLSWAGVADAIQYTYTPYLLGSTSFKMYDAVYSGANDYRQNRTLLNKHGVKIDLLQGGDLGAFSFQQLLLSLTTSLTLLAVATVVTDYVALYLLPDKERYDEAKYEWTEDFSDMRDQDKDEMRRKRKERRSGSRDTKPDEGDGAKRLLDSEEYGAVYGHERA